MRVQADCAAIPPAVVTPKRRIFWFWRIDAKPVEQQQDNPPVPARPKRPKIAFFIHRISGRAGGAERVLIEAASEMKRRGFSVDIVTYEDQSPKLFFPLEDGINLVNLDDFDARPRLDDEGPEVKRKRVSPGSVYQWLVDRRPLARSLRDHVKRSGIDVLIPFLPPAMATAAVASFGMRTPLIASTHNDPRRDFSRKKWSRDAVDVWVRKEHSRA